MRFKSAPQTFVVELGNAFDQRRQVSRTPLDKRISSAIWCTATNRISRPRWDRLTLADVLRKHRIAMSTTPFTRPTIIAAVAFLDTSLSQASFNHMVLRLGLENDIPSDATISVSKKADRLGRIVVQRPDDPVDTLEGRMSLAEAVVREAVKPTRTGRDAGSVSAAYRARSAERTR